MTDKMMIPCIYLQYQKAVTGFGQRNLFHNGDVEELARTAFILGMDTKTLCSEDCKGLCPTCGADLNLGPCTCKKAPDPRLAVLSKLLQQDEHQD